MSSIVSANPTTENTSMSDKVSPIPEGVNTVSAYLIVSNTVEAMEFYERAFGAEPGPRIVSPGGESTQHAEMKIGNSTVMLSDEFPELGAQSPLTLGGSPQSLHLYVEDVDALYERAVAAGCTVVQPLDNAFWGDRYAKVTDPFGHSWGMASRIEELSLEQISQRGREWMAKMQDGGGGD
jgi:PhnB protein